MINRTRKIQGLVCFGDSIFAGTGASDRQIGSAKLIKNILTIPVSLQGRNRDTSEMAIRRLEKDILSLGKEYTQVIVLLGNNDCWLDTNGEPRITLETFEANMVRIINLIQANGREAIICNLQPIHDKNFLITFPEYQDFFKKSKFKPTELQEVYSNKIENICKKFNLVMIDIREEFLDSAGTLMADDGIHPNDLGHKKIAKKIISTLGKLDISLLGSGLKIESSDWIGRHA